MVVDQIVHYVESLEVTCEWLLPRRHRLLSFSQNIVTSGYSVIFEHEFASIVPFHFGFGLSLSTSC